MANTHRPKCPNCGVKVIGVNARIKTSKDDNRPTSARTQRRVGWICGNCMFIERTVPAFSEMLD